MRTITVKILISFSPKKVSLLTYLKRHIFPDVLVTTPFGPLIDASTFHLGPKFGMIAITGSPVQYPPGFGQCGTGLGVSYPERPLIVTEERAAG